MFKIIFLNEIKNYFFFNHKTILFEAIKKQNIEIVKLLLSNKNIDVNILIEILKIKY